MKKISHKIWHINRFIFSLLVVFINLIQTETFASEYYFKSIGVEKGLSQSRVQCMLYDYKGFMWIGTQCGLNCYDQDRLTQFFNETNNNYSLPSNDILFIMEDKQKKLWIGTGKGLCTYDREEVCFTPVTYQKRILDIHSALLVDDGILLAGDGELYKYEYTTNRIKQLPILRKNEGFSRFKHIAKLDEKTILLNTRWYGIYAYDLHTGILNKLDYVIGNNFTVLHVDKKGRIWTSCYGKGIFCYEKGQLLQHFNTQNSPLTYDVILDIKEKDGAIWLATDGGGINTINLHTFTFQHISQIHEDITSFPSNAIYSLYVDPMDNMWAGSIRNGLIGICEVYAKSFQNVPFHNPYGPSNQTINCFYEDKNGLIWIGTDGGGVNCYNPQSHSFKHYAHVKSEKVTAILEYNQQELLIFLFNKGLYYFNKTTGATRPFIIIDAENNESTCINGYSVFISRIAPDQIMLSADHLYIYNITTKVFEKVASKDNDYLRNSPLITQDSNGKIFIIDTYHIYEYQPQEKRLKTCYQGAEEIFDACTDNHNNLWIATDKGLFFFDTYTQKRRFITTNLFKGVNSVLADNNGHVWIGTKSNLLFVYTIHTNQFSLLGESDGVIPNEYLFRSMLLGSTGDIYVGGALGMTLINKDIPIHNDVPASIVLADVLLNGAPVKANLYDTQSPSITVPWNFSSIKLKVVVKEDDIFRKHAFRYFIHGEGKREEINSFNHSFTLNHLPIGHFTISASYTTPNGEWSTPVSVLKIQVTPPWWQTSWFWGSTFLLLASITFVLFKRLSQKRKIKRQLEIENLKEKMYKEKIRFLTNVNHELRTPLTLISSPLKRILDSGNIHTHLKQQLSNIYKQSLHMRETIDLVLNVRKLEEGKEVLYINQTSLNEWICDTVNMFEEEFKSQHISLIYHLNPHIGKLSFDKSKCASILCNLLTNALKFSESNTSITITSSITEDHYARVAVTDEGIGLHDEDIPKIFTLYYQGTHGKSGSGIGLSYAKSLAELHNGRIGAFNNPVKGATFYFELPLVRKCESEQPECALEYTTPTLNPTEFQHYSILIIEDTKDLRNYLKNTMMEFFSHVYTAKDGIEGLLIAKQQLPDIVISDVMMPRMDGFKFCENMKKNPQTNNIPIILLTAYNNDNNMSTSYKLGADAFLPKPFEIDVLLSLINNQLKLRKSIKAKYQLVHMESDNEKLINNADEAFLSKLNSIIDQNMASTELNVAFLTEQLGISRSLLFNKIKQLKEMGIVDYVNQRRVERAIHLLQNTNLNISEISEQTGFSTPRYFSRVFKQITGNIPSRYRHKENHLS